VRAEVISERHVPPKLGAAGWTNVKVMWRIVDRCKEGLAFRDAQVSPMDIA
jgi:hypothetical protein